MAEMAFTMISLCRLTSTPSFMLWSTVVLHQSTKIISTSSWCDYSAQTSFTFSFYLMILIHLKMQHIPVFSPFITSIKMFQRYNIVPVTNAAPHWRWTYGISSGSTSARMLIESVLALEVGAAASRIFSRAIWWFQKREWAMKHPPNLLPKWQLSLWCVKHCQEMLILTIVIRSAPFLSFWTVNCH